MSIKKTIVEGDVMDEIEDFLLEQQELEDFAQDDPIFQPDAENYEYERSE